jgi:2-iminobutanoate/2-iminopropanoate deaminase
MPSSKKVQTFGPYTPIRGANGVYFVSGQVGVDPNTKEAKESVEDQTTQVLRNLLSVLASEGLTMRDVVKTTVYLTSMKDFETMNVVYLQHFATPRPARSTVGVKELPNVAGVKLKVEIEAVAIKDEKKK